MSRITNPETESSVSCGFYNSLNDRRYDAAQMSRLFDGIIRDGVFASIGTCFVVKADSGNRINVGTGKCWFDHTWTENDAILPIECEASEILLNRIDAVVIEINSTEDIRDNFIKVVKGAPSSSPSRPALTNTRFIHQHALCYINRPAGSTGITQADITNVVGTAETPFVTGILETINIGDLLGQWESQLDQFISKEEADFGEWYAGMKQLLEDAAAELDVWSDNEKAAFRTWTAGEEAFILEWFQNMKDQLSSDSAVHLQNQMDKSEVERILLAGLADGEKTFSDDGTEITTTDSSGRTLVKTFTNGFLTCTTVLKSSSNAVMGRLVKTFSSDGKTIRSELTIV